MRKNQPQSRRGSEYQSQIRVNRLFIYVKEKKELKRRSFGKVVGEAVELVFYPLLLHFLVLIS
ncbi:MAG: hypothetical protein DRP27_05165 [Thermotogae bacterium]|nr:MAG: hypothetical protein DRP27_05165 [Thermotogota bacterium]